MGISFSHSLISAFGKKKTCGSAAAFFSAAFRFPPAFHHPGIPPHCQGAVAFLSRRGFSNKNVANVVKANALVTVEINDTGIFTYILIEIMLQ